MRKAVNILEVGIDKIGRLCVRPQLSDSRCREYVYRAGKGVYWDKTESFFYSPVPEELSYFDWYNIVLTAAEEELGFVMSVSHGTTYSNLPEDLIHRILNDGSA